MWWFGLRVLVYSRSLALNCLTSSGVTWAVLNVPSQSSVAGLQLLRTLSLYECECHRGKMTDLRSKQYSTMILPGQPYYSAAVALRSPSLPEASCLSLSLCGAQHEQPFDRGDPCESPPIPRCEQDGFSCQEGQFCF